MQKSEQINELATALAKAQAKIESATKSAKNPFYKSNYADLPAVWESCRKHLTDNGLSVVQLTDTSENGIVLESVLLHSSGQWISCLYPINPVKNDPQGVGSATTYARRYSLMALVGIVADNEDDDGEKAMGRETTYQSTPNRLTAAPASHSIADLEAEGREAAEGGLVPLQAWWARLPPQQQVGLKAFKDSVLKPLAEKAA